MRKVFHRHDIFVHGIKNLNLEPGDIVTRLQSNCYYLVTGIEFHPEAIPEWATTDNGYYLHYGFVVLANRVFVGKKGLGIISDVRDRKSSISASWLVKCIPKDECAERKVRLLLAGLDGNN